MIFQWTLKKTPSEGSAVIRVGSLEAEDESEALRILNEEMEIYPHIDEILDIQKEEK